MEVLLIALAQSTDLVLILIAIFDIFNVNIQNRDYERDYGNITISVKSLFFCVKCKLSKPFTAVLVDILLQFYYRFSKRATIDIMKVHCFSLTMVYSVTGRVKVIQSKLPPSTAVVIGINLSLP